MSEQVSSSPILSHQAILAAGPKLHGATALTLLFWLNELGAQRLIEYPGGSAMAALCGASRQAIHTAERELQDLGLVVFQGRGLERQVILVPFQPFSEPQMDVYRRLFCTPPAPEKPTEKITKPKVKKVKSPEPAEAAAAPVVPAVLPVNQPPKGSESGASGTPEAAGVSAAAAPKAPKLSDADKALICSSLDNMTAYLLWGKEGIGATDTIGFKPSNLHWRYEGATTADPKIDKWTSQNFMGYYWFLVCQYRAGHNIPLTLPMWSRLAGDMKNLMGTMTKWQFYRYIRTVCAHFDLIRFRLGRAGQSLSLNETTLIHTLVRNDTQAFMELGQFAQDAEYERMSRAQGQPAIFET